ncbi:uncharacterized protein [Spinacia oleracea]|uniref:Aspartic peptidase DDI1-type domain-containing protein n=1 Tax=Spinacia oleracea TaxID=3562 RepID=A0A9R0JZ07_SPIOL|nr:uncharacterized protein LOC110791878 [Spinacia oleracea]
MIETQLAQLANTFREHHAHASLPPQSHTPRQMNAIVTRSGKILDDVPRASKVSKPNGKDQGGVIESSDNDVVEEEPPINDVGETPIPKEATLLPLPTPKLPYPQRFIRHKLDVQFSKFLDVLRNLHITLPFTEALKQMPTHSRFLKEILSGKRDCDVKEMVNLTENCSAIILNQMPPKLKDPCSFSIPCAIKELEISNSLCHLGASVSLMPYSVFSKLEVGDLVPTNITLQLADRSVKYPIGKVEDVPLRVGGLVIPVDFVVLDIDEDVHVPIILGRPFLATAGAIIDVKQGNITLKVGKDSLFFDLNKAMRYPSSTNEKCLFFDSFDPIVNDMHEHLLTTNDPLELVLLNRHGLGTLGFEVANYKELLDAPPPCAQPEECMLVLDGKEALDAAEIGKEAPKVELKPLPSSLRYAFLGPNSSYPVIINSSLDDEQVLKLTHVLKRHQRALGYTIGDLKGVSPTLCMHHIDLEDNAVPHRERQRKLNPPMGEVVKKEIIKLLAAGIIYPISNS